MPNHGSAIESSNLAVVLRKPSFGKARSSSSFSPVLLSTAAPINNEDKGVSDGAVQCAIGGHAGSRLLQLGANLKDCIEKW